jgi:hypothetical protein
MRLRRPREPASGFAPSGQPTRLSLHDYFWNDYFWNWSSISTWYPVTILFVSLAMPTIAMSSLNMASVMPFFWADAVCEAMQ